jgi:hypothetical protein
VFKALWKGARKTKYTIILCYRTIILMVVSSQALGWVLLKWVSWLLHQTESQVCYVISEAYINAEVTGRRKCVNWGGRSWIKPIETVSLKGDNQWNKWPYSGLQTVINVKLVSDITYVMYLLCCRNWEIKSEIGLIHVGTSQLVLLVPTWQ